MEHLDLQICIEVTEAEYSGLLTLIEVMLVDLGFQTWKQKVKLAVVSTCLVLVSTVVEETLVLVTLDGQGIELQDQAAMAALVWFVLQETVEDRFSEVLC